MVANGGFDRAKKMTTINLRQEQKEKESHFSPAGGNGGVIFSLGILIFTLLVLMLLKMYVPFAQKNSDALTVAVADENQKLVGLKSLEQVVDMQKRLTEIKSNLEIADGKINRLEMTKVLDQISGDLNPNVVLTNFKFDKEIVELTINVPNFGDVAKQLLNFKKSEYFTNVGVSSMSNSEGAVTCVIAMGIKK